jgi:AcrR family transcriptional regulator
VTSFNTQVERLSRRERAERTRGRILEAAFRLFSSRGYEATTMQEVADAAEVAVQTVYLNFRTKAHLLAQVENLVILGGEPVERWRDQPWARQFREERDPEHLLDLFVDVSIDITGRIAAFVQAVGGALPNDAATVAERERGQDDFFGMVVDRLDALSALRNGLTATRALDILRALDTVETYVDLVQRRGWTRDEYRAWLRDLLRHQLLSPA